MNRKSVEIVVRGCKGIAASASGLIYDEVGCTEKWIDAVGDFIASAFRGYEINIIEERTIGAVSGDMRAVAFGFDVTINDPEMPTSQETAEARWLSRQLDGIRAELIDEGGFDPFIIGGKEAK